MTVKAAATSVSAPIEEVPKTHPTNTGSSFTDCAQKVLEEFGGASTIHDRHVVIYHRRKIILDRGLDIFQYYKLNYTFTFASSLQQYHPCKAFEMTFVKQKRESEEG